MWTPIRASLALRSYPVPHFALLGLLCTLLTLPSCGGTEPDPPVPLGDGVDPTLAAADNESRAGRIGAGSAEDAAVFGGISAEGGAGDIKLYNSRIQVIIQGAYKSHGYVEVGGNIIDADVIDPRGSLGRDTIDDVFLGFGAMRLFEAREVLVVADGSNGGPAVVRATGEDVSWRFIQGAVEAEDPLLESQELDIVVDYELAPGSDTVKITVAYTNAGAETNHFNPTLGIMASDEDLWPWSADVGLEGPEVFGDDVASIGSTGKHGEATLSLWQDSGAMDLLGVTAIVSSVGFVAISHGWTDLAPGESLTLRHNFTVAADTLQAEATRRTAQGEALAQVAGQVLDATGGLGIAGVRVHFVDSSSDPTIVAGFTYTDAEGRFEAQVPPGDWDVYAVARGVPEHIDLPIGAGRYGPYANGAANEAQLAVLRGESSPPPRPMAAGRTTPPAQQVTASSAAPVTDLTFSMQAPGLLEVTVHDDNGRLLPAAIEIDYAAGAVAAPNVPLELRKSLGVPTSSRDAGWAWTSDGSISLPLPPGSYDVTVQHSFRHERTVIEGVEVLAGDVAMIAPVLAEVVPLDGWMSMDSHLHAAPSNDGSLGMEDRLIACAATGIQLPVTTDHDRMADYRPLATALGLDSLMTVIPGLEVSPVLRGHHNLFPVEPDVTLPNGGALSWWQPITDTADFHAQVRESGGPDSLIQVNHPRSGLFDFAGLEPATATPARPDFWSWDFDMFELINGKRVSAWEEVRADWFGFLNAGQRKVPTGVSDSHSRRSPCGYGRTDVYLGLDEPSEVTPEALSDALRAGHVVVAGGLTMRVTASDGASTWLPGDLVESGSFSLAVRVSSPSWLVPTVLRLYKNGEVIEELSFPETASGGVWMDQALEVSADSDAWFVVEVEGDDTLGGIWGSSIPYAASNAFFVDVDADGWTGPVVVAR